MNPIKQAIRTELRRVLDEKKITVDSAARQLGVTRQAFHLYLSGASMPRPERLTKAVELWDLKLKIGESSFGKSDFARPQKTTSGAIQLQFWQALDSISKKDLKIAVKRVGKSLRVAVQIDIPA